MNQREILTSGQDSGGFWHAFYASASRTLCNVARPERGQGVAHEPTCEVCVETAQAFGRIDGSCPPHWFRGAVLGEVAVVERLGPDAAAASSSTDRTYRTRIGPSERVTLDLVAAGKSRAPEIASARGCKTNTVQIHLLSLLRKGLVRRLSHGVYAPALSGRTGEAGPSPAETESRGLARMAPGKTPARTDKAAANIVSRFAAIRNHIDRMERELLDALEREAA